jgi:hypothetical protein
MNVPETIEKWKNYPEGSEYKRHYDSYHMPFQKYLNKYFTDAKFPAWSKWKKWFGWIEAAFDDNKREVFSQQKYYRIGMDFQAMQIFYKNPDLNHMPEDIKKVIAFLKYDGFFEEYNVEVGEWLNAKNFRNPKQQVGQEFKSINELVTFQFGDNYIRDTIIYLPWWDITRGDLQGR